MRTSHASTPLKGNNNIFINPAHHVYVYSALCLLNMYAMHCVAVHDWRKCRSHLARTGGRGEGRRYYSDVGYLPLSRAARPIMQDLVGGNQSGFLLSCGITAVLWYTGTERVKVQKRTEISVVTPTEFCTSKSR